MTGLPKQVQSMPFVQGPDTKTDPKLAMKPSRLENAVFRGGSVQKRWGRTQLTSVIDTGGSQNNGKALFSYDAELCRINGGVTYGLSPAASEWVTKQGGNNYCTLTQKSLVNIAQGTGYADQATINGVSVLAWSGGHIAVYDATSGGFFQTGATAISTLSTSTIPRCVVLGLKVVTLWADISNGNLYSAVIDTTAPESTPTATLIRTDIYTSAVTFDAVTYNNAFAAVVYPTSGTALKLIGVDPSGAVTSSPAVTSIAAVAGANGLQAGLLIQRDTAGNIYIVIGDKSAHLTRYIVRDGTFASVLGITSIVTTGNWSGTTAEFYTGASIELTANNLTLILANYIAGSNISTFLGTAVINSTAVGTAFSELASTPGLIIAGDLVAFDSTAVFGAINTDYGGNFVTDTTGLQSSAWVVTVAGKVVGKSLLNASYARVSSTSARVPRGFASGSTASFIFPIQGRLAYQSSAGQGATSSAVVAVTPLNIAQVTVAKTSPGKLPLLRLGATQYLGGGYPRIYDGRYIGETGFQLFPDLTAGVVDNGGGGNLLTGTYQWKLLYSYINSNGELTRGPPSPAVSFTFMADSHSATIKVAPMPLAMRDLLVTGGNTQIELYRTTTNGNIFYRASSVLAPAFNIDTYAGLTSSAIPIVDNLSDTDLQAGEILYTTGGILDWEAPPAYSVACVHKQRLIIGGLEDSFEWMPSSQWTAGETVRFSSFTAARIPATTGPITGLGSMDGKLIIFTSQTAYLVIGDGPDQLGNNPYPPAERIISVDSGPLPGTPIVETPLGLMYQSQNGIQLLDRGLNSRLIGAEVVEFSTGLWTLRSAFLDSTAQQVRFLLDTGRDVPGAQTGTLVPSLGGVSLLYDYFYSQWSVFPNYGGQAACEYQGQYTMVRSDGVCWQEVPGTYLDQGAPYSSLVETNWIKQAGPQGFQRLWYATLLGTYGSACTLNWDTAFSYSSSSPSVPIYNAADSTSLAGPGVFEVGGSLEFRHFVGAKCSAVKFRFYDSSISGSGQGMGLSDLSFEWAPRKGVFKLPATQTA